VNNLVLDTETSYLFVGEICLIIRDDGVRVPKAIYNILPKKFDNLMSCDIGEWHRFYPLGEVVHNYQ